MIAPDCRFSRHPDVAWRQVQDDALLVDPRTGRIFPLNAVAARIWILLDSRLTVSEITKILIEEFDAPPDRIREDADEFISKLMAENMLIEEKSKTV